MEPEDEGGDARMDHCADAPEIKRILAQLPDVPCSALTADIPGAPPGLLWCLNIR